MTSGSAARRRPFSGQVSSGLGTTDPLHDPEGPLSAGRASPGRRVLVQDFVFRRRGCQRFSTELQSLGPVPVCQRNRSSGSARSPRAAHVGGGGGSAPKPEMALRFGSCLPASLPGNWTRTDGVRHHRPADRLPRGRGTAPGSGSPRIGLLRAIAATYGSEHGRLGPKDGGCRLELGRLGPIDGSLKMKLERLGPQRRCSKMKLGRLGPMHECFKTKLGHLGPMGGGFKMKLGRLGPMGGGSKMKPGPSCSKEQGFIMKLGPSCSKEQRPILQLGPGCSKEQAFKTEAGPCCPKEQASRKQAGSR